MNTQPSFKGIVTALALALSWMGCGQPLQAQAPVDPIPLMKQALTLLETADHDYEGHRAAAVKDVQAVLRGLKSPANGKVKKPGVITPGVPLPPNFTPGAPRPRSVTPGAPPPPRINTPGVGKNKQGARNLPETQAASDAQLQQAEDLLVQATSGLSDVSLQRINQAIAQIHTALTLR